jgi:hypothetical protein
VNLPPGWPFLAVAAAAGIAAVIVLVPRIGAPFDTGCVPGDFPRYPGLQLEEQYHDQGHTVDQCNVVWKADADGSQVEDFYSRELQRGDWELVQGGTNPLLFRRHSHPETNGSLAISAARPSMLIFYLRMPAS